MLVELSSERLPFRYGSHAGDRGNFSRSDRPDLSRWMRWSDSAVAFSGLFLFDSLLAGFSFSPGQEYSPAAARGATTGKVVGWAVGGAVGVLVIGGIRKLMRR